MKKKNKINTIILIISIIFIITFFIMMIFFRHIFEPFIIPFMLLGLGLIGMVISISLLIINSLKLIGDKKTLHNPKIIVLCIILFTIISTYLSGFSWLIFILLLIINISVFILFEGGFKFTKDKYPMKRPHRKYKIPFTNLFLLLFVIGFTYYSPFNYYSAIIVFCFSIFSSYFFINKVQDFFDKVEKLPKQKAKLVLQNVTHQQYTFILMFPIIIDMTFSVLKIPLGIHIAIGILYLTSYIIVTMIFAKKTERFE